MPLAAIGCFCLPVFACMLKLNQLKTWMEPGASWLQELFPLATLSNLTCICKKVISSRTQSSRGPPSMCPPEILPGDCDDQRK